MYDDHSRCLYYDHNACMYYDHGTCMYYDHSKCLYYDCNTFLQGVWGAQPPGFAGGLGAAGAQFSKKSYKIIFVALAPGCI